MPRYFLPLRRYVADEQQAGGLFAASILKPQSICDKKLVLSEILMRYKFP